MYHHKAPHRNWQPAPRHLNRYDDVTIPEPETLFDDYQGRASPARNQNMMVARDLTPHDLKLSPQKGLTEDQLAAWNQAYEPQNDAFQQSDLKDRELVKWKYQRYAKDYLRCIDAVDENVERSICLRGQLLEVTNHANAPCGGRRPAADGYLGGPCFKDCVNLREGILKCRQAGNSCMDSPNGYEPQKHEDGFLWYLQEVHLYACGRSLFGVHLAIRGRPICQLSQNYT